MIERQLARLPDGTAALARAVAVLGPGATLRHAAGLAGLEPEGAAAADALRAAGLLEEDSGAVARAPSDRRNPVCRHAGGARALRHADAAVLVRGSARTLSGWPCICSAPSRRAAATVAACAMPRRATRRGAPQSAATYLRRALGEPPPDTAVEADVQLELALALAAYMHPDAFELLDKAIATADTPMQRGRVALRGARACGLAGYFEKAMALSAGLGTPPGSLPSSLHGSRRS